MKKISNIFLAMTIGLVCLTAQGQNISPVDFMRMNPYQMRANPATDLPYESVMSLVIGNIGMDLQNTSLRYDNMFDFDAQGRPSVFNLRKMANSMKNNNFIGLDADFDIFTIYRRLGKGMFSFDYSVNAQADVKFNDGMFKLLGYGNSAFVGEDNPIKINMDINATLCQEVAVGYQWKVSERLSLGARGKLLFGVGNVNTQMADVRLFTDPNSYALRLEERLAVRTSMPTAITLKDGVIGGNGGFQMSDLFRNPGFGIDFGAEYRLNDQFSAVAAIHDLGFIRWSGNNIGLRSQIYDVGQFYDEEAFLFSGLDVDQLQLLVSDEAYRELFLDTLKQYFNLDFYEGKAYTTMLNTNVLLRGNYDLDANNRFSAQLQGRFLGSGFRPGLTLAYNGYFYDKLDVCVTYTLMPHSYDNIGLGIAGRLFKTCQVYLMTGNLLGFFAPLNTGGLNVRAGIVFVLRPEDKNTEYE